MGKPYRFRTNDCRIYFEVADDFVVVHRVLHKNSFSDFLFRSKMPISEDEQLAKSKHFWKLIDEGQRTAHVAWLELEAHWAFSFVLFIAVLRVVA